MLARTSLFAPRQVLCAVSLSLFSHRTMASLPSTLTGPPVESLVPPNVCQFTDEFRSVPLLESFQVSDTSSVFRFGLPDASKPLNLSTCACILAKADLANGECVVRPYTPISTNANVGYFDLLVKHYGPTAKMSKYMHDLQVGDTLEFKHIAFSKSCVSKNQILCRRGDRIHNDKTKDFGKRMVPYTLL